MAAGKQIERELQGCCNLLGHCLEGRAPTASAVAKMSPFSILLLEKTVIFVVCTALWFHQMMEKLLHAKLS